MTEIHVRALASWLPEAMLTEEAVARGLCEPRVARQSEMLSVTVARDNAVPAELAVRAARRVLDKPGCDRIGLLLHAASFHQGIEVWSPASYVQRRTIGDAGPAIEIRQASNGGLAAIDLAHGYLTTHPDCDAALITTADRFTPPFAHRWRMDPGTVYADGGTALVLARHGGFARITGLAMVAGSALEGMHRPGPAEGIAEPDPELPVALTPRRNAFLAEFGTGRALALMAEGTRAAAERALADADVKLAQMDAFALPHFIRHRLRTNYLRHFDIDLARTTWSWNRRIGHLGAGDQVASLTHLVTSGRLRAGQRCLLMAVGAGFTWSAAVVEIDSVPDWLVAPIN